MADSVDQWAAQGRKNLFGETVKVVEMQSEGGAAGVLHGSLTTGALTTTYTASQGLLLMIPNMYKIAGELLPAVFHVSARALAYHALSIFGDHSDVMACRQTGFAMLCSNSVQEAMDLAAVAHLSAIKGRVPFLHFFDGFRTSHEIQKIEVLDYEDLRGLVDMDAVRRFRENALNPEHPVTRGTAQNPDIYFQGREASNRFYDALPDIVEGYMADISRITGRDYRLFNYYGAPDAERVLIAMGSVCEAAEQVVGYLNRQGEKVGLIEVHLYRPFKAEAFLNAVPLTAKKICVLDRVKENTGIGEPLYTDVCAAFFKAKRDAVIVGGRYGLGSKDTDPNCIIAAFDNLKKAEPVNDFALGITDDVTGRYLPVPEGHIDVKTPGTRSCMFWGLGADGTVGANKNTIKIIGDNTDLYAQAYFDYDSKKSGGVTISHLRFGRNPIRSTYLIHAADFVACHASEYVEHYDMTSAMKDGGTFLLSCRWAPEDLEERLPARVKRDLARKHINFYIINAITISRKLGLGGRTNTVLQAAFFKLADILPIDDAVRYMKDAIKKTYGKKGSAVVEMNCKAVDAGLENLVKIDVPAEWADAVDEPVIQKDLPDYVRDLAMPILQLRGNSLPVSAFSGHEDGTYPTGTTQYEKRGISSFVPGWKADKCIQCNRCSYVCPHAAIRPFLLTEQEAADAPGKFGAVPAKGGKKFEGLYFKMQLSLDDCLGCGSCIEVCPVDAFDHSTYREHIDDKENWEYALTLSHKDNPLDKYTVKGSQFQQPLLEFSGACAGCGETPYVKLMTQLFGDRMLIANATGCSSIWGASEPTSPYTKDYKGHGPAWSNSLFEDAAEFGLGMLTANNTRRKILITAVKNLMIRGVAREACANWLENKDIGHESRAASEQLVNALTEWKGDDADAAALIEKALRNKDLMVKKSQWVFGGDGWAYDIGYGGLDHVLASGEDINLLVLDTEVYSNTGGQASKATPVGAVAQFAASGKRTKKKDLGMMAVSYGYVYVAQVAMGADPTQLIKAVKEAESYPGPSIVIAYAPCINHGIKGGMRGAQAHMKQAVECGYWHLWRYDPRLKEKGSNPFILDSKEPTGNFREFIMSEARYSALNRTFPEEAEALYVKTEKDAKDRYDKYYRMSLGENI